MAILLTGVSVIAVFLGYVVCAFSSHQSRLEESFERAARERE